MSESLTPNRNLWKNLRTEKTKQEKANKVSSFGYQIYSNKKTDQDHEIFEHMKISTQTPRISNQFENSQKNIQQIKSKFSNSNYLQYPQQMNDGLNNANVYHNKVDNDHHHTRNRRHSIGDESVVEEIVDFKQLGLDIAELEEDQEQQPMIMSLGSQTNIAVPIKQLKLKSMKDEIIKLRVLKQELSMHIESQKKKYQSFFQLNFNNLIAYVLQFYAQKLQAIEKVQQKQINSKYLKLQTTKKPYQQLDTPKFPKQLDQMARNQIQKIYKNKLQNLQHQLRKINNDKESLQQHIHNLQQANQDLNQLIFELKQKVVQAQLEVNAKVQQILEKEKHHTKPKSMAQADRNFYLQQIKSLQQDIQILQGRQYQREYTTRQQKLQSKQNQLLRKQMEINQYQSELKQKQKYINELQVEIHSQKLDIQKKIKQIQLRQSELRSHQSILDKRQLELAVKQREFYSRRAQNQIQAMKGNIRDSRTYANNQSNQAQSLGVKLKNLSDIKFKTIKPDSYFGDKQRQNTSYFNSQSAPNWRNHHHNRTDGYGEQYRQKNSNSKQKSRHKEKFNKSFGLTNKPANLSPRAQVSMTSTFLGGASLVKNKDKTRLQDLGAKLENLRNQIKKQIRDAE